MLDVDVACALHLPVRAEGDIWLGVVDRWARALTCFSPALPYKSYISVVLYVVVLTFCQIFGQNDST